MDHPNYLTPLLGSADIFFATDFAKLAEMVASMSEVDGGGSGDGPANQAAESHRSSTVSAAPRTLSQAAFMAKYAQIARTKTMTGFNPLLEDYPNMRVLLS